MRLKIEYKEDVVRLFVDDKQLELIQHFRFEISANSSIPVINVTFPLIKKENAKLYNLINEQALLLKGACPEVKISYCLVSED